MDATQRDDLQRLPDLNDESLEWAAYFYARAGIPVFPLVPRRKIPPRDSSGFLGATTDIRQVQAWWRDTPDANIGIATGHECDVPDVDTKDGKPGDESFSRLDAGGRTVGAWAVASTPSGGRHVLFAPSGDGCHVKKPLGLDFRGDGGYIVAPPSYTVETRDKAGKIDQHEGGYQWRSSDPDLRGRPFDWQAAMLHLGATQPRADVTRMETNAKPATPQLAGLLRRMAAAEEGERNSILHWAGCRLAEHGYGPAATDALAAVARQTGLPDHEILRTLQSAGVAS